MPRYEVRLSKTIARTYYISARSAKEAVVAATVDNKDMRVEEVESPDTGESVQFIAWCEASGKPILEGDDYVVDPESSVYILREYVTDADLRYSEEDAE